MAANERKILRCAVYTRKSSEHGLEQDFNSLDAQREAAEAYIKSQAHEGWRLVKPRYDDGGISGGTLERPALQSLLTDIQSRKVDIVVVYKVDRLTRSLADFAKLVELFEAHGVSFVAVTQQFNTTTSMVDGAAHPQCFALLRPVRARAGGRAHPRQVRGLPPQGHVDGRHHPTRLRR
jgi:DNA invertase Pin-like site-specific DNA recombinase